MWRIFTEEVKVRCRGVHGRAECTSAHDVELGGKGGAQGM